MKKSDVSLKNILHPVLHRELKKMLIGQTESGFWKRRKSDSKCILHSSFPSIKMQKLSFRACFLLLLLLLVFYLSELLRCTVHSEAGARLAFAVHSAAK